MSEDVEDEDVLEEEWPEGLWLEFPNPDPEKDPIQRWFETEDDARDALIAASLPPRVIREALKAPSLPWMVVAHDDEDEPLVYRCEDMPAAIKLILTFCDEDSGIDGLEALRTLEQAASDGLTEVAVGPYRAMMDLGNDG